MKPEMIMQTDLLDILFDNRNKDYGAYVLRSGYNRRLTKAVMITIGVALLFSIVWYVQANFFRNSVSYPARIFTDEVILKTGIDKKA